MVQTGVYYVAKFHAAVRHGQHYFPVNPAQTAAVSVNREPAAAETVGIIVHKERKNLENRG
jgi:hypothetical protein